LPGFRRHGRSCVPDKEVDRNAQELVNFSAAVFVFLCFCAKRFIRGFPSFAQNAAKVWKEPKLAQLGTWLL
jgi:hypothetical protein